MARSRSYTGLQHSNTHAKKHLKLFQNLHPTSTISWTVSESFEIRFLEHHHVRWVACCLFPCYSRRKFTVTWWTLLKVNRWCLIVFPTPPQEMMLLSHSNCVMRQLQQFSGYSQRTESVQLTWRSWKLQILDAPLLTIYQQLSNNSTQRSE